MNLETIIKHTRLLISLDVPVEEIRDSLLRLGLTDDTIYLVYHAGFLLGVADGSVHVGDRV